MQEGGPTMHVRQSQRSINNDIERDQDAKEIIEAIRSVRQFDYDKM